MEPGDEAKDPLSVFELICKLGEGSYGSVVKARHIKSQQLFAIKLVPIEENDTLESLMREVDVMRTLQSDYILRQYCTYVRENLLWIVLEFCPGGSVSDYMRICQRTFAEEHIASVARDMLHGLVYLHGQRKIHRDIKAGNVLLASDGRAKLADFGVAGQLSDRTMKRITLTGTPYWMAPEVVAETGYDNLADIWSLGITCIEMADGRPPFHTVKPMLAMVMIPSRPPPTVQDPSAWSPEFIDFISSCLVKDPTRRPSAEVLLKHPFLRKASSLKHLVAEELRLIEERGMQLSDDEDDDEGDDDGNTVRSVRTVRATARRAPPPPSTDSTDSTDWDDGTVRRHTDGTTRGVGAVQSTASHAARSAAADTDFDDGTMRRYPDAPATDPGNAYTSDTFKYSGTVKSTTSRSDPEEDAFNRLSLEKGTGPAPGATVYLYGPDGVECVEDIGRVGCGKLCRLRYTGHFEDPCNDQHGQHHQCSMWVWGLRNEAMLQAQGAFVLRDAGSSSGTFLNGARLSPPKETSIDTMLVPGDAIRLGISLGADDQPLASEDDDTEPSRRAVLLKVLAVERRALHLKASLAVAAKHPRPAP